MDIHSATWKVAVDAAGIWPCIVDMGNNQAFYLLSYHRAEDIDRVLTVGPRTLLFANLDLLNLFVLGPHDGVDDEVHLALEVLSSLSPHGLAAGFFPRTVIDQTLVWIQGGKLLFSEGQVERLLGTLAFLGSWHDSLEEEGAVGIWPDQLGTAEEILHEVMTHRLATSQAARELSQRALRPVLEQEIRRLVATAA